MQVNWGLFLLLMALLGAAWHIKGLQASHLPALPIATDLPIKKRRSLRSMASLASFWLFWAALVLIVIAICNPRMQITEKNPLVSLEKSTLPREGIAIYFLVDESGSMNEKVSVTGPRGDTISVRKIDLAKKAILEFVEGSKGLNLPGRKNDLIGLLAFARVPEILCPLTLNRQEIASRLKAIEPVKEDVRNGTAIGYAIFKAVNIIVATEHFAKRQESQHKSAYNIANQAIIIITDGLQSPNPNDKENPFRFMPPDEAINYAKDNGVRVFYVGIDPILAKKDFASDVKEMKALMQASGGELFLADSAMPVEEILRVIDTMEKSVLAPETVVTVKRTQEKPVAHHVAFLALLAFGLAVLLETTIGRVAP